jgi:type II secretory pathway pseudopilin PulG
VFRATRGFSLVEALVATALVSTAVAGLVPLLIVATTANQRARATTLATVLAVEKIEQLQGLLWAFDASGQPLSDTTSDLTTVPDGHSGPGLSPSPAGTLQQDVQGYCDFFDSGGGALGSGAAPPAGAAFVRRWSVEPAPFSPGDTLVLQVVVGEWQPPSPQASRALALLPREVRLVGVKTRKVI